MARFLSVVRLRDILILVVLGYALMFLPKFASQEGSHVLKAKEVCFRGEKMRDESLAKCTDRVLQNQNKRRRLKNEIVFLRGPLGVFLPFAEGSLFLEEIATKNFAQAIVESFFYTCN